VSDSFQFSQKSSSARRRITRLLTALVTVLATLAALVLVAPPAMAATSHGHLGPSYSGVSNPPTSDKPQSKLWFNDGSWWATMWTTGSGWHIWRLDRGTESWVDTGVLVDTRTHTLNDTMWDGTHLFIASQYATVSTGTAPVAGITGQPAKLYRYSYSGGTYTLDAGFPTNINNISSETLTIDEDTTGRIWSSWVQISGSSSSGYTATVYANVSGVGGTGWGTPFAIPNAAHPSVDDISAVVAFKGKIGVMWSDEASSHVYFALHTDGAANSTWSILSARSGTNSADDHINLKTVQTDATGRVYAVLKTSLDLTYGLSSTQPGIVMLTYTPGTNTFATSTVSRIVDCQTRPQLILDSQNSKVHVVMTGPDAGTSGCPSSGKPGAIYEKTASMGSTQTWTTGRGTAIIEDGASLNVNNPTTTKQTVTGATGFVVLASNDTTKKYWFSDESLGAAVTAPVANFTVSPATGTAGQTTTFTNTSTGSGNTYSWNFGDGSAASTSASPTHVYATQGTYSVTLTATNAGGSNAKTVSYVVNAATTTGPVADFTASPTTGTAGQSTTFTNSSTGTGNTYTWDFGDGSTSTAVSPTHTYATANTYTVKLIATNSGGSNEKDASYVVNAATTGGGTITVGASSKATSTTSVTAVTIPEPTGVATGDVLVANINANNAPTVATVPSGWTQTLAPVADGTVTTVFSYYHVVTGTEPASWTFTLSAAQKWSAGITAFRGVDTTTVWDTAAATQVSTTGTTSQAVPSVTTVTPGALLIGGNGVNSSTVTLGQPSGWTEAWEADGGKDIDLAYKAFPTAGPTGTSTFTHSATISGSAWVRALKPA
jgi:PKD repeat protein